jgi:hypothetical protein
LVSAFTNENPIGTRAYLFKPGELRERYDGWEAVSYKEQWGGYILPPGETEPRRYRSAWLVAKRPE